MVWTVVRENFTVDPLLEKKSLVHPQSDSSHLIIKIHSGPPITTQVLVYESLFEQPESATTLSQVSSVCTQKGEKTVEGKTDVTGKNYRSTTLTYLLNIVSQSEESLGISKEIPKPRL